MEMLMRLGLFIGLAGLAACASTPREAPAQAAAAPPQTPVDRAVSELAADGDGFLTAGQIGLSRGGRPLHLLTLANGGAGQVADTDSRPALLIVAGIDARHTVGTDTALGVARRLVEAMKAPAAPLGEQPAEGDPSEAGVQPATEASSVASADVFDRYTIYIVPQLNPDGAARLAEPGLTGADLGWALVPHDSDHDGRIDEDGPQDLNGDGVVTMMRVKNPPPGWGLDADQMVNPDEPRLTKSPDRHKGERAEYAVLVEGRDVDGDGKIAEDGPGGVDLDRNFPYRWPEYSLGAGRAPLSEPETRALVDWMLSRRNIVAVLTFGPGDNLINVPEGGKTDWTGQVPLGLEADDRPYHEKVAEAFKEITKQSAAPASDSAGTFRGWAYAHFGLFSFSTPVWVRPEEPKKEEKPDGEKQGEKEPAPEDEAPQDPALDPSAVQARMSEFMSATPARQAEMRAEFERLPAETRATLMASFTGQQPEGGPRRGGRRGGPGGAGGQPPGAPAKAAGDSDDDKWLRYSDTSREGSGFIAWTPFDHPDLGPVEIGGFVPGFKLNPPAEELTRLAEEQARFVGKLLERLPFLIVDPPTVEPLGGGLWRIGLRVSNGGLMPTRAAIGVKARRLPPIIATVDLPEEAIISGRLRHRVPVLPGAGGQELIEWVIAGREGQEVSIKVVSPEFGEHAATVTLGEDKP
jgi:hypothetical protein